MKHDIAKAIGNIIGRWIGSWLTACLEIWLITICFSTSFSWNYATGIWLIMCLLRRVFR